MSAQIALVPAAGSRTAEIARIGAAFEAVRDHLNGLIMEREQHIELLLTCVIARQHMALVGLPGAAKSMLADAFAACITPGASGALVNFRAGCHPFTTPEAIFGGLDFDALKGTPSVHRHNVAGMLPTAHIARLDEAFKLNPSMTHTLLGVMNEREFTNGPDTLACPLITLVATSNELPMAKEQAAFWDRFLVRMVADRVSDDARPAYLAARKARQQARRSGAIAAPAATIGLDDLALAHELSLDVAVPDAIDEAMLKVWRGVAALRIDLSERRIEWCYELLCAHAILCGRDEVTEEDLDILQHVLWVTPEQRPDIARLLAGCVSEVVGKAREIVDQIHSVYTTWKAAQPGLKPAQVAGSAMDALDKCNPLVDQIAALKAQAQGEGRGVEALERLLKKARDEYREIAAYVQTKTF